MVLNTQKHPLTDTFDKIYIINLAHRQDRRDEMQAELAKIGLSLQDPHIMLFTAVKPDSAGEWPSIGAKGCFMSHLGVLQHAKQSGYSNILILEDDLNFVAKFNEKLTALMQKITEKGVDWQFFYGGYELEPMPLASADGYQITSPGLGIRTTHFVGFSARIIPQLIDYLTAMMARPAGDPQGGPMHVDGAYGWFRKTHPQYTTVIATPELGYQRSSQTDIYALGWKDRLPIIKDAVRMARKVKNYFRAKQA